MTRNSPRRALSSTPWRGSVSLMSILQRYPGPISVTWGLLLCEALLELGLPLAIGRAVDGYERSGWASLGWLAGLCAALLVIGAGRRFYDSRAYARLHHALALGLAQNLSPQPIRSRKQAADRTKPGADLGAISGRVRLVGEITDFFEHELPALIGGLAGFAGVMALLLAADIRLAGLALAACLAIFVIYALSSRRIFRLNCCQNTELERQLPVLAAGHMPAFDRHIRRWLTWMIRLSDLEVVNYSAVWLVLASMLCGSVLICLGNAGMTAGARIASIMYVLQLTELVLAFPFLYQQILRMREITSRLSRAMIIPEEK